MVKVLSKENNKSVVCFFLSKSYILFSKKGDDIGGAEVNLYYLATHLAKNNSFKIKFLVGDYGQPYRQMIEGVELIRIRYLNDQIYPGFFHKLLRRVSFIWELLKLKSDVIITSTANEFCGYIALTKVWSSTKLLFRVAHDWDVNGRFTQSGSYMGLLYGFALKRFERIVCQNEDQRRKLLQVEGLESVVIKNGFPLSREINNNISRNFILWIARSDSFKRPHLFLDLALRLPSEKFIMIMPGTGNLKEEILHRSKKIPNLSVIDYVPFLEIFKYFREAKCFVNTSDSEGFPNTFLQCCLNGTPILSYLVDPDKIIQEYGLGFVCHDDPERGAEFIRGLTSEGIKKFSNRMQAYMIENHDLNQTTLEYERIIYTLIEKNRNDFGNE